MVSYVMETKAKLGSRAIGRREKNDEGYELRNLKYLKTVFLTPKSVV